MAGTHLENGIHPGGVDKMDQKPKFYSVNKILLPVKLHYLFVFGGYGGVIPFQSLLGKGLGISATAVGFINTALMILTLLSKPFLGTLVDYFRNIRIFLISLVLLSIFSSLTLLLLSPIEESAREAVNLRLKLSNSSENFTTLQTFFDKECFEKIVNNSAISCRVLKMENVSSTVLSEKTEKKIQLDVVLEKHLQQHSLGHFNNISNVNTTYAVYVPLKASEKANLTQLDLYKSFQIKCQPSIHPCSFEVRTSSVNEYETYQFWVFASLLIFVGLSFCNTNSLSDVACYEILGEQRHLYGRQRMFGTLGWSLACLLSGYLSDIVTGDSLSKDYSPGYYIMACLLLIDIVILSKMPLVKVKLSSNIWKDVNKVFYSSEIVLFAIGAMLSGLLTAVIGYYELWYLQDLGASQSLLGWVIIVQCLIAEAPFFMISGWFVKKIGCFNCLVGSFAAYALRFGGYSLITNPWWALLIDTTHGFTFAMFHAAMTNFVSTKAPKGVEGTMFGIFGGLIDGMGQASGSLLCGAAFDKFGGRLTFTVVSIFSGACALAFIIASGFLYGCSNRTRKIRISSVK